jgi:hypothetical protein
MRRSNSDHSSELVGEVVEVAVKNVLSEAKVSFRETKRAERIPGFDQAPDFIIPDEFTPVALIEAKLTEDDGTARDSLRPPGDGLNAYPGRRRMTRQAVACPVTSSNVTPHRSRRRRGLRACRASAIMSSGRPPPSRRV